MSAHDARRTKKRKTIRRRAVLAGRARCQSEKALNKRFGRALRKLLRGDTGADWTPRYDYKNTLAYRRVSYAWQYG